MEQNAHSLRIFICHSSGDKAAVRNLYDRLCAGGFDPWLAEEKLLPGHNWHQEIAAAVRKSDIVIVCLSRDSINKRGVVQREIRYALDVAAELPERSIFIIPIKLEECEIPEPLSHLHWMNFFEDNGYEKLLASLKAKLGGHAANAQAGELPARKSRYTGKEMLRDLFKGLFFITCALAIKFAIDQTMSGKQFNWMIYDFLNPPPSSDRLPVAVVDISDLKPAKYNADGQTGTATSREVLRGMIEAICEYHPKAIGVTIDFSQDQNGYIHPRDPEFFQFCLDLRQKKGVPVFLGVRRALKRPAMPWFGDEKYQALAANLLIPFESRRMWGEIQAEDEPELERLVEASEPSRSISVALADSYERQSGDSPGRLHRLREYLINRLRSAGFITGASEKRIGKKLTVTDFPMDLSRMGSIKPIKTIEPTDLTGQSYRGRFEGKVVLIGRVARDEDRDNPDILERKQPYPSILLHACAAYTLIHAPLYDVTITGRLGIDIFFSLMILSAVILTRRYFRNKIAGEGAQHRLQGLLTLLIVVAAIISGVLFARATRVMWYDFLSALIIMIFHPSLERRLENFWNRVKKHASTFSRRPVFQQNRGASDDD